MLNLSKAISAVALSLLLISSMAAAQSATSALNGHVRDQSGAVLPGVTVTATQTDTGVVRDAVTDGDGAYLLSNLPTGPYRLEASLQGFRSYVQTGIVLQVGGAPTVNIVLQVGNLEESVTVEGAAPLVDVKSTGISQVIENQRIVELPLQGRQVTDLLVLAGSAVQTSQSNGTITMREGVSIAVGGGQPFGVAYVLDGAMHNNPQDNANLPLPFPDALQEFRVATSGLSADNGMHSGASVNAVTKSGTNQYHGNAFEFLRDHRFNSTDPFAKRGADGKPLDDGLKRNQFGGTFGGPLIKNKLFFFGAYQGTITRQTPAANIAFVPNAAMLAGDFTTFASAACNGGRAINLGGGFVNNRIDPARFSPAALNLAARLPTTADPCGQITYTVPSDFDQRQTVGKVDYQLGAKHALFGRYMATWDVQPPAYAKSHNLLTLTYPGLNSLAQSFTTGDTMVLSSTTVNSLRFAYNRTANNRYNPPFFEPYDLGSNVYSYSPAREMVLTVTGGFNISSGTATKGEYYNNSFQGVDDVTLVRGRHQLAVGANVAYWNSLQYAHARSGGNWTFNGQATGLGLADFLLGRVAILEHGGPGILPMNETYIGLYGQDSWRASNRLTLNAGLRWEPFFGQNVTNGALSNFSLDNFEKGVKSTVFHNAPAGLIFSGDAGFPSGKSGIHTQWWNFSPRLGLAWDVTGNGRLAIRSSYGLTYDFPSGQYHYINATAPPFGNRTRVEDPPGLFDNPYQHLGGDPHPIATSPDTVFPFFGSFGVIDPNIQSPRIQSWNVTVERQLGTVWQVAASYLGSYSDRLWGPVAINPGVYLGLNPCTINGTVYPVCSTNANLNNRRVLYLENPSQAQYIGALDLHDDVGTQTYRGLKLSAQRRSARGLSIGANYTWSLCVGNATQGSSFSQISSGYTNPADPNFDRGHCLQDRTHLSNSTVGYETPHFAQPALRAIAADWRISGIITARSGDWLNVTTGRDNAFNGIANQRVNKISDDVYGAKTLTNYLNVAAFAQPANGTFGNLPINAIKGPAFWKVDMALSRVVDLSSRTFEFRLEAFNVLNHFNWGDPNANFGSGTFGRITSTAGDMRILQFGVKYGF